MHYKMAYLIVLCCALLHMSLIGSDIVLRRCRCMFAISIATTSTVVAIDIANVYILDSGAHYTALLLAFLCVKSLISCC